MAVVVVESPAKAKTINKYLGDDYTVLASYGHVRDLPPKDGSVDPEQDFAMVWEVDSASKKHVRAITEALKSDGSLILATDPDREGEAISWHLLEALKKAKAVKPATQVSRVTFNAITKQAVGEAMKRPRDIDMELVSAYLARRALDYLVGFTLSPVLWRKLPGAKSAGRVQSVALRLIVQREMEIEAFRPREYWTVRAELLTPRGDAFEARLVTLDGAKLDRFDLATEADALKAVQAVAEGVLGVASVEARPATRNPWPPFMTSTLQQEASRKLGFGAKQTMSTAQRLYEAGWITYMRTDGVDMAPEAVTAARSAIESRFGKAYVPDSPRVYKTKAKNAQEAHECIRPTEMDRGSDAAGRLEPDQRRLYELIWKRTLASQMASARLERTTVEVSGPRVGLRATGQVVKFDGFLKIYDESRDDDAGEDGARLPEIMQGEKAVLAPFRGSSLDADVARALARADEKAEAKPAGFVLASGPVGDELTDGGGAADPAALGAQSFTQPPPRYTEATLVKRMEELGIGRPSTYASIIDTIQTRGYVQKDGNRLIPEDKGRLVTAFLEEYFSRYVQYDFTAALEEGLDEVSGGRADWKALLREFWGDFSSAVDETKELRISEVLDRIDAALGPHLFPDRGDGVDPRQCRLCGAGRLSLKTGKFGAFIGCSNYPECKYTRPLGASEAEAEAADRLLGHSEDGLPVTLKVGRFGPYVQMGEPEEGGAKPKRASVPKGMPLDAVDLARALDWLALPRLIGAHPEDGEPIEAGIGRFGPYVKHGKTYANLPKDEDVLTIGMNRAVDLIEQKRARGPGRGAAAAPLRVLGEHPDGGPVELHAGRYGPYVKWGKVNATLPKEVEAEAATLEMALPLIAEKAPKKKAPAKKAAAKSPAKAAAKAAVGKTAKKKAPAAKATAGKAPAARAAAKRKAAAGADAAPEPTSAAEDE
ncbi:type I DNA topoisomerase [Rubrimonas cliftonensis]|uniref:DNA topoisomerase 1 n=1 Tax=Rubrimonas cliftonensis TaxID=89524 RepID=A0A1H3X7P9_9RHOB|nr:type I DNA topoisomerase [Rubrimonas cliftonensis]SDZ95445.1 DNA topoisomerase I [Rubrimonas cliftonensis]